MYFKFFDGITNIGIASKISGIKFIFHVMHVKSQAVIVLEIATSTF